MILIKLCILFFLLQPIDSTDATLEESYIPEERVTQNRIGLHLPSVPSPTLILSSSDGVDLSEEINFKIFHFLDEQMLLKCRQVSYASKRVSEDVLKNKVLAKPDFVEKLKHLSIILQRIYNYCFEQNKLLHSGFDRAPCHKPITAEDRKKLTILTRTIEHDFRLYSLNRVDLDKIDKKIIEWFGFVYGRRTHSIYSSVVHVDTFLEYYNTSPVKEFYEKKGIRPQNYYIYYQSELPTNPYGKYWLTKTVGIRLVDGHDRLAVRHLEEQGACVKSLCGYKDASHQAVAQGVLSYFGYKTPRDPQKAYNYFKSAGLTSNNKEIMAALLGRTLFKELYAGHEFETSPLMNAEGKINDCWLSLYNVALLNLSNECPFYEVNSDHTYYTGVFHKFHINYQHAKKAFFRWTSYSVVNSLCMDHSHLCPQFNEHDVDGHSRPYVPCTCQARQQ